MIASNYYIFLVLVVLLLPSLHISAYNNDTECICVYCPEDPSVGPYCAEWYLDFPPFCYLSGASNGSFCPGAVMSELGDFYWSEDSTVCAKSADYVENNCNCYRYDEWNAIGPYCLTWDGNDPPYCFISGGQVGRFCLGAVQQSDIYWYWTDDMEICNRSNYFGPLFH